MSEAPISGNADCDDILRWLDTHSTSLSRGVPAQALHRRWLEMQRTPNALAQALQRLFAEDWISLSPGREPPHLRFTVDGFRRLLEAQDAPRSADDTSATTETVDIEATPVTERSRAPASESSLRNGILDVYRDLRLRSGQRLISVTLQRYWQEQGNRASDLRAGLDLLERDGMLVPHRVGIDHYWTLSDDGQAWIDAPPTHPALLALAAPAQDIRPSPAPVELQAQVARLLMKTPEGLDYPQLQADWHQQSKLDDNGLLLGLDLLIKQNLALIGSEDQRIRLTEAGLAYAAEHPRFGRLLSILNKALR